MADKINGYGRVGLDVAPSRGRPLTRTSSASEARDSSKVREGADAVALTDTASRLKRIEARLAALPDIDQARVDEMRKRIDSGDYRPDAARIAEKLVRMEKELG
jgi:negative regulator of flagellin synthesis FlgM